MNRILESDLSYKKSNTYNYKTIPIYAEEGVHEGVFFEFINLKFNLDSKILILGCGAGSFDQRLIDAGYNNITSIDIETKFYKANNPNILVRDLNLAFGDVGEFDVIFAIEIIEHIENQFHFIRNISTCLNNEGYIFLTTPNIDPFFSRVKFLVSGIFNSFSINSLDNLGHINPILNHIFLYNIKLNKLELIKKIGLGKLKIKNVSIKNSIGNIIYTILGSIFRVNNSIINFYIIKK